MKIMRSTCFIIYKHVLLHVMVIFFIIFEMQNKFTYKDANSAYQRGILTPQVVESVDTKELRHYLYTVGNPALDYILDNKQNERHQKQAELTKSDLFDELVRIDQEYSSPKVFQYLVAEKEGKDLDDEIKRIEEENALLKKRIETLKASMEPDS